MAQDILDSRINHHNNPLNARMFPEEKPSRAAKPESSFAEATLPPAAKFLRNAVVVGAMLAWLVVDIERAIS